MSMTALKWAFEQDAKAGAKAVLVALAWHADKDDWKAWPGVPTLAMHTGLDEAAVIAHARAWEASRQPVAMAPPRA